MKKSAELVAFPTGVVTEMRPEPPCGALVAMLVVVAEVIVELTILNVLRLLSAVVSKFVPAIVTAVPGIPIVGVNPVTVGAPGLPVVTVNDAALVVEPVGDVIATGPEAAPVGTLVTTRFGLEAVTVAATPLNVTAFWFAVALKPVP